MEKRKEIQDMLRKMEKYRKTDGKTQEDLANKFGITRQAYSDWLSGRRNPSKKNLEKIEKYIKKSKLEALISKAGEDATATLPLMIDLSLETWKKVQLKDDEEVERTVRKALQDLVKD